MKSFAGTTTCKKCTHQLALQNEDIKYKLRVEATGPVQIFFTKCPKCDFEIILEPSKLSTQAVINAEQA